MRRLVIDTATGACSVALFEGSACIALRHEVIGRGHAERLVPMIAELPDRGRADAISVDVGPGSFTGIRVGVSAARALALAWNATCEGYGSLALLAAIARSVAAESVDVDVATHGGHGELFFQAFDALGQPAGEALSLSLEAAAQRSSAPYVTGDAAVDLIALRHSGQYVTAVADAAKWPLIAANYPLPSSPAYVRGPDAKLPTAP